MLEVVQRDEGGTHWPKAEAKFSRGYRRVQRRAAGSRVSKSVRKARKFSQQWKSISEADVTGFPGQGRTCPNCEMGMPAVRGESVSTGSARKPQAESGFGVRFGPRIQRSDLTGHSRDCEPARFIRPGSPGYFRAARRFRLNTETRKGSGGALEGNGCGKAPDLHHREAPQNGGRPAARTNSDLRVKR